MNRILMYHSVGSQINSEVGAGLYCVSVEKFRGQMSWVSELASYRVSGLNPSTRQPTNPPTITFDDGLLDSYTKAYPILKALGLRAYFFILAGKVGTAGYMDWKQIKELKDAGMLIGSHGMTHRILTELNDAELDYELKEAKNILEDNLGCAVDYLSIPRGFHNKKIIRKAKEAGYKTVFTSNPSDNDGFAFGRIPVKGHWSFEKFIYVINNGLPWKDRAGEFIRRSSRKVLGARNYDWVRSKLLGHSS